MSKKIIIIGGVAGGATAAARLRRLDETAEIIMIERGKYVSYANCGLPYYVGGVIMSREALLVQTPESLKHLYNLDVRIEQEVVSINREQKTIAVKDLKTSEVYQESYDNLVLATGSEPVKPPIPGVEAENLFTLRTVEDADAIKEFVTANKPQKAVIIGAGFIGIEIAENLKELGLGITMVEMLDQVMGPLDKEMAAIVANHIREQGVSLQLNNGVKEILDNGKVVILNDGSKLDADIIILAIGVKPEYKLAKEAGLDCAERAGVIVNEKLQTSDASIYALGDVIQVKDRVSGNQVQIPLAWPANRQARIVADNICGKESKYLGTLGAAIFKCFDLTVAMTGNSEKQLKKLERKYQAIHIHPNAHANYYPGANTISLKLVYDSETGEILGAQGLGRGGVDKRLDVISTAMQNGMKAWQLQDLELAYAPPYSSAKDPVNMLGYIAEDIRDGLVSTVQWYELDELKEDDVVLDVRENEELVMGGIKNAVHIPLTQLRDRLNELDKGKTYYAYCLVGLRAYIAVRLLLQQGYKAKNVDGGLRTWAAVNGDKDFSSQKIEDSGSTTVVKSNYQGELNNMETLKLDACGLQCPGPLLKVSKAMKDLVEGGKIEAVATDPAFPIDMKSWCSKTGNTFVSSSDNGKGIYQVIVQKGDEKAVTNIEANAGMKITQTDKALTIIVFNGDLDKAIAAFIIANGALAFGKKVTIFFTFWGLNVLRKDAQVKVKKNLIETMFGWMMPRGANKLALSNMNMAGMGPVMIKYVMKQKNVDSLPVLIQQALDNGGKLIACTMSMDIMGIKQEELIEGVEFGGVATYLGEASEANINLFI